MPTENKILVALRCAGRRLLLGMIGTWCAIGPFILLVNTGSAGGILTAMMFLLLLLCYAVVLLIYLGWRWVTLTELVSETGLALCFIIVGELVGEMMGAFATIKGEMALISAFTGFFIAELIKPKSPIKALSEMFSARFRTELKD